MLTLESWCIPAVGGCILIFGFSIHTSPLKCILGFSYNWRLVLTLSIRVPSHFVSFIYEEQQTLLSWTSTTRFFVFLQAQWRSDIQSQKQRFLTLENINLVTFFILWIRDIYCRMPFNSKVIMPSPVIKNIHVSMQSISILLSVDLQVHNLTRTC